MATLILTQIEAELRRTVGPTTFLRGQRYARAGVVAQVEWIDEPSTVCGQVRGSARSPYSAMATMSRAANGTLQSFHGACTCPVGVNCKHTVALALTVLRTEPATAERPSDAAPPDASRRPAAWEKPLANLLRAAPRPEPAAVAPVALQFELINVPATTGHHAAAARTRLGVRPVRRSHSGNWVRSGVTWSNLSYGYPRPSEDQLRVIKEFLALNGLGQHSYYSYSETIFLESARSRRLWDLLAEAQALDLPLVGAGRAATPVVLHDTDAELSLELTRLDADLVLHPRLRVGSELALPQGYLLLGEPAHGLVWWQAAGDTHPDARPATPPSRGDLRLRLARLAAPIDAEQAALLDGGAVRIPAADEERFLAEFYPRLRQRLTLVSPDDSVALPEPEPPVLSLTVHRTPDLRATLAWGWTYPLGTRRGGAPLWEDGPGTDTRDPAAEREILQPVAAIAAATLPALLEETPLTQRLAPAAELDALATLTLVTEVLPRLDGLPGVHVEVTGAPAEYREAAEAPVIAVAGSPSAADRDWFDLAVTVTVAGEQVVFNELFIALAGEQPFLMLPSGTYFSLDREEFRDLAKLIAEARALQDAPGDTITLSRFHASLWNDLERIATFSAQASAWQSRVAALANATDLGPRPQPVGLEATLRPYQEVGFARLAFWFENRLGGILADEMGLGKTLQTLAMICDARERGAAEAPFLVVAPTSVVHNWEVECHRFAPDLAVATISETRTRRGATLAEVAHGAHLVVTSYTLFRLEYDAYAEVEWSGLVLDEAQFVKNDQAQSYKCAKTLPTPFKLAITGTPMENNVMELWSLLSITAPGLFAHRNRFEEYYRRPIERGNDVDLLAQLRRRIHPLMLRRTKKQVAADLPDKQEQVIELELNPRHRKVYQTHLQRERQKVLGLLGDLQKNRFEIFRSITLLRQASLDAALIDPKYAKIPSTKLDALMEQLDDVVSEGHRTLVFSQFTRFLQAARRRLDAAGIDYCYLDGRTRKRTAVLDRFTTGTAPVFLISLKAGGFGLNLTEADYCILLDPWWNPATEAQAVDRVHRIGQTKKVMVYRLVAKDTIEEKVMALKARKAALFTSVMENGEFASAALSAADIRGLLT